MYSQASKQPLCGCLGSSLLLRAASVRLGLVLLGDRAAAPDVKEKERRTLPLHYQCMTGRRSQVAFDLSSTCSPLSHRRAEATANARLAQQMLRKPGDTMFLHLDRMSPGGTRTLSGSGPDLIAGSSPTDHSCRARLITLPASCAKVPVCVLGCRRRRI